MFIDPKEVIDQLELSWNEIVVDLGAGSGAYSIELAKRLADGGGKVYAVDVQQDILTRLAHTAQEEHLSNIAVVHADIEKHNGVHLQDGVADLAIISNTLYCAQNREGVLSEAARLVRTGGLLLLIDWKAPYRGMGPEEGQVVTEQMAGQLAGTAGFAIVKSLEGGSHHWVLLCIREATSSVAKRFAI